VFAWLYANNFHIRFVFPGLCLRRTHMSSDPKIASYAAKIAEKYKSPPATTQQTASPRRPASKTKQTPAYVTFTEGESEFPYLNAAKQTLQKKPKTATQITNDDDDESNTQVTTTTLTSELDNKINKMKKAFTTQLDTIKEQNEARQKEYEVRQQNLVDMMGIAQRSLQELVKSRTAQEKWNLKMESILEQNSNSIDILAQLIPAMYKAESEGSPLPPLDDDIYRLLGYQPTRKRNARNDNDMDKDITIRANSHMRGLGHRL